MYRSDHLDAGHPVDRGVVHLEHHPEAALREPLDPVEPFDDVHLPEGPREIEGASMQARCLDAELAPVPRLRQREVPHVVLEVEVAVLDPVRMVEVERHPHELPAERVREVHTLLQILEDPLERDLTLRRGRLVVDHDARHVRRCVSRFAVHERGVESAELLHGVLLSAPDECGR